MSDFLSSTIGTISVRTVITVLLIILGAVLVNAVVREGIRHWMRRPISDLRMRSVALFFQRTSAIVFGAIGILMILDQLSIDTRPILTGAGIAGITLSLGAQALLKDVFAGIFIFLDGLYAEGDVVLLEDIEGTVEKLTLRKTVLRDAQGKTYHIPHGNVKFVGVLRSSRKGKS